MVQLGSRAMVRKPAKMAADESQNLRVLNGGFESAGFWFTSAKCRAG